MLSWGKHHSKKHPWPRVDDPNLRRPVIPVYSEHHSHHSSSRPRVYPLGSIRAEREEWRQADPYAHVAYPPAHASMGEYYHHAPVVPSGYYEPPRMHDSRVKLNPMIMRGNIRIDMSKPAFAEAIAPIMQSGCGRQPATNPGHSRLKVKCSPFEQMLRIQELGEGRGVTIEALLAAIYRYLHTCGEVDDIWKPDIPFESGKRKNFFDSVVNVQLLHGQHVFVGLEQDRDGLTACFE